MLTVSTKGNSCDKGSGLYITKRGCVSQHPPFLSKENIAVIFFFSICSIMDSIEKRPNSICQSMTGFNVFCLYLSIL